MLRHTRSGVLLFLLCLESVLLPSAISQTTPMPKMEGESLSGHKVVLPDAAAGKVAVLIFGFSRASKVPTRDWAHKLSVDFGTQTGVEIYQLPVLEEVPRFIRGMVISGMKKDVPANAQDRFVPILQREAELKKAVNFKEPDDAYLIVLDRTGKIVQQLHGSLNDESYRLVREEIELLLNQK